LKAALAAGALLAWTAVAAAAEPDRLDVIRARGHVNCGIPREAVAGFSVIEPDGAAWGFDVDFCRALAAAIFGSGDRVRFVPVDTLRAFLATPTIDVVFHGLTWNFARDVGSGLRFGPVIYHDGQALLVRAATRDLAGARVCVEAPSAFAARLAARIDALALDWTVVARPGRAQAAASFFAGECEAWSADASMLFAAAAAQPGEFAILPERFSKEPLAPVLRAGDERLLVALRWVIYATIEAEEAGLARGTIDDPPEAARRAAADFHDSRAAEALGLPPHWPHDVVKAVGHYGEIYARNLRRPGQPRHARGANENWTRGGLHYAPPLR
jgi:general L-amino acid transport system substrate-binding protein